MKKLAENGATHMALLRELTNLPLSVASKSLEEEDPVWWAERNLRTDHGTKLDFSEHPYLELIYEDWHPTQCYYKAAQVGMTQTTTGKLLYFAMKHPITGIYTMPTQNQVERYSTSRFNKIISHSPVVKAALTTNNAGFKVIADSQIYFSGTFNEQQAISVPADIRIHDELDFSKDDIVDLYEERLAVSEWKISWMYSTPTILKFGVHALWLQSDQRHWFVKCSSCGRWQRIRYDIGHEKHNMREIKRHGRHIRWFYGCTKCDTELDRRVGRWVTKKPSNSAKSHGYAVPQTIVPIISAEELKDKEEKARRKGQIKKFHNFNLGEAFTQGKTLITKELIRSRMHVFKDNPSDRWFMGVDQGDEKHYVLCQLYDDTRVVRHFGILEDWGDIEELIRTYNPKITVIDAQPNKDSAKAVRDKFPGKVFIVYYKTNQMSEIKRTSDSNEFWEVQNKDQWAFSTDMTESLDKTAAEWVEGRAWLSGEPGTLDNPKSPEALFVEHMTNLKRDEEEDKHGNMIGKWVKVGPDHFRHADNYARLALDIFGRNTDYQFRTGGQMEITSYEGENGTEWFETPEGFLIPKKSEMQFDGE
jgi:hypothetical protein